MVLCRTGIVDWRSQVEQIFTLYFQILIINYSWKQLKLPNFA